jgi:Na+-transporting NADH:ubiquinone oxidoreductase subunit NqrF
MVYLLSVLSFSGLTVGLAAMLITAERFLINYGICKLDINVGEKVIEVSGGRTLLSILRGTPRFVPNLSSSNSEILEGINL